MKAILAAVVLLHALSLFTRASEPELPAATPISGSILDPKWGVGCWIWTDHTFDKQTCRFWKSFEIPASSPLVKAKLRITADNGFRVFLDGRELGKGSDWRWLNEFDLLWLLAPGRHVLAVEAVNDALRAGLLAGFRAEFMDGQSLEFGSDKTWRIVPETERNWQNRKHPRASWITAERVGSFEVAPWDVHPRGLTAMPPLHPIELRFWQEGWFQITVLSLCGVVILVCLRLIAQLALQAKANGLLKRERARIARDIHDDLGAGLTQLVLLGELAQNDLAADPERRAQIEQLCEKTRVLLGSMDEVVWAVNSRRDTLRDFAVHACKYAQAFTATSPIRCRLDVESDLAEDEFALPVRRNLFLGVKEALRNSVKHSRATEILLRIHRHEGSLVVVVEDNGTGFDPAAADSDRNGLSNMQQRMLEVGGDFLVETKPGSGCRIHFRIPLAAPRPGRFHWLRWLWFAKPASPSQQFASRADTQPAIRPT